MMSILGKKTRFITTCATKTAIPTCFNSVNEISPRGTGNSLRYIASSLASLNSSNIRTIKKRVKVVKAPTRKCCQGIKPSSPLEIREYDTAEKLKAVIMMECATNGNRRSEEHKSELQSLMRNSNAVF